MIHVSHAFKKISVVYFLMIIATEKNNDDAKTMYF